MLVNAKTQVTKKLDKDKILLIPLIETHCLLTDNQLVFQKDIFRV
jgi:hypothetical protein